MTAKKKDDTPPIRWCGAVVVVLLDSWARHPTMHSPLQGNRTLCGRRYDGWSTHLAYLLAQNARHFARPCGVCEFAYYGRSGGGIADLDGPAPAPATGSLGAVFELALGR